MTGHLPAHGRRSHCYAAPTLVVYGTVTKLTANGTKNSIESNGGYCGNFGSNKNRC